MITKLQHTKLMKKEQSYYSDELEEYCEEIGRASCRERV